MSFSVQFVRNVYDHFGFIWPVTKINVFGFLTPHLIINMKLGNFRDQMLKQMVVRERESCPIR